MSAIVNKRIVYCISLYCIVLYCIAFIHSWDLPSLIVTMNEVTKYFNKANFGYRKSPSEMLKTIRRRRRWRNSTTAWTISDGGGATQIRRGTSAKFDGAGVYVGLLCFIHCMFICVILICCICICLLLIYHLWGIKFHIYVYIYIYIYIYPQFSEI